MHGEWGSPLSDEYSITSTRRNTICLRWFSDGAPIYLASTVLRWWMLRLHCRASPCSSKVREKTLSVMNRERHIWWMWGTIAIAPAARCASKESRTFTPLLIAMYVAIDYFIRRFWRQAASWGKCTDIGCVKSLLPCKEMLSNGLTSHSSLLSLPSHNIPKRFFKTKSFWRGDSYYSNAEDTARIR